MIKRGVNKIELFEQNCYSNANSNYLNAKMKLFSYALSTYILNKCCHRLSTTTPYNRNYNYLVRLTNRIFLFTES